MRRKSIYIFIVVAILLCCMLVWWNKGREVAVDDAVLAVELIDSAKPVKRGSVFVYGRLGENTGMSCVEFITTNGDTLLLNKVSEFTGREGDILGTLSPNPAYVYAVCATDNNGAVDAVVNMTELRASWTHAGQGFSLVADSTVSSLGSSTPVYKRWSLDRNRLLLCREVMHEGGVTEMVDTMTMVYLDADTLELVNGLGEHIKYAHP